MSFSVRNGAAGYPWSKWYVITSSPLIASDPTQKCWTFLSREYHNRGGEGDCRGIFRLGGDKYGTTVVQVS